MTAREQFLAYLEQYYEVFGYRVTDAIMHEDSVRQIWSEEEIQHMMANGQIIVQDKEWRIINAREFEGRDAPTPA